MSDSKRKDAALRLEYGTMRLLRAVVGCLPPALAVNLGAAMGAVAARIAPVRRDTVRKNLRIAFGDSISRGEENRLVAEAYKHLGMMMAEGFAGYRRGATWTKARITEVEGLEAVEQHLGSGRGAITVTGHFGNWELLASYEAPLGRPRATLAKKLHNHHMQDDVERQRRSLGTHIIWAGERNVPAEILKVLNAGGVVNFLADQDMRTEGIFVPFFGRPASTTPGPALFAIRKDVPLIPVFIVRLGPLSHRLVIRPPIFPEAAGEGCRDERVAKLTGLFVRELEDIVRLYPAQYFWFHRRWKTTPEAVAKRLATLERRRLEKAGLTPRED